MTAVPPALAARLLASPGPSVTETLEIGWRTDAIEYGFGRLSRAEAPDVTFDYYRCLGAEPRPTILCTPILGGDGALERGVARSFAEAGFHAVLVRREGRLFKDKPTLPLLSERFTRMIRDRSLVLDWLERRPEVDASRIGAFGISMGGIVTAALTPLEPRIHSAVMVMAGGDVGRIILETEERPIVAYREHLRRLHGWDDGRLLRELRGAIAVDPLELARYLEPERVLCIISEYDDIVPTAQQRKLWAALGGPEAVLVPSGHYSAIAFLPLLRERTIAFFDRRFARPNDRPQRSDE